MLVLGSRDCLPHEQLTQAFGADKSRLELGTSSILSTLNRESNITS